MSRGSINGASHWTHWVLVVVSVGGCSDKGSSHAGSTPTSGRTTADATVTASSTASTSGSSASHTASGGAPTTNSVSGGPNTGSSASDGGGLGGEAGGGTSGGTTGAFTEPLEEVSCSFSSSHAASEAVGTVRIVTWSTDLPNVHEAWIEFGLTGSDLTLTAPVDLAEPNYRTLLLGMKGDESYGFRIVANSKTETCTSPESSFTTGPVPEWVPTIIQRGSAENASQGFIITTSGLNIMPDSDRVLPSVYIFDTDSDVVWWTTNEATDITSARMSWDGKTMWSVRAYGANLLSVSMDGSTVREHPEVIGANHDIAVLPDGGIATMLARSGEPQSFVEMKADGSVLTIVPDLAAFFGESVHPNAVHYYPDDDTFTLSNLTSSSIVKFTRTGELLWQLGNDTALGNSFELVGLEGWDGNHGHHLDADGHLLFFNNRFLDGNEEADEEPGSSWRSRVFEVLLDDDEWTATKTWEFSAEDAATGQLGDVQRLPNGNVLITYSNASRIIEVAPSGEVVQSFDNAEPFVDGVFGYATFRTSLYGPPPR